MKRSLFSTLYHYLNCITFSHLSFSCSDFMLLESVWEIHGWVFALLHGDIIGGRNKSAVLVIEISLSP